MIKLYDILKAEKTGLSDSLFTALLAKKLSGSPAATVKTLEGVPPLTFSAIGEPLIEWSIDGNMQQTGTPTSSSPIFPSETGDKTENLFDYKYYFANRINSGQNAYIKYILKPSTKYTVLCNVPVDETSQGQLGFFARVFLSQANSGPTTTGNGCWETEARTITSNSDGSIYILMRGQDAQAPSTTVTLAEWEANGYWLMFVEGEYTVQTMPNYEPYGFAIPVQCGNTTNNIYLSEPIRKISTYADTAPSTGTASRKINKYVVKGYDLSISAQRSSFRNNTALYSTTIFGGNGITNRPSINSHFPVPSESSPQQADYECSGFNPSSSYSQYYYFRVPYSVLDMTDENTDAEFITAFNRWLQTQYQNGTPVTVWYVLATAETESFTAPTIPTSNGSNTLNVNTTLAPSNVYIKYKG